MNIFKNIKFEAHWAIGQKRKSYGIIFISIVFKLVIFIPFLNALMLPLYLLYVYFAGADAYRLCKKIQKGKRIQQGECTNSVVTYGISWWVSPYELFVLEVDEKTFE